MARRGKGERVLGPYPIGKQWRVVLVGAGGERDSRFYPTKEKAEEIIRAVRREFARGGQKTVQEAFDAYEEYLLNDKQNKAVSVANTMYRLGAFFPDKYMLLGDLTPRNCDGYYGELRGRTTRVGEAYSVDSHRTILAAAKTFLRWCSSKPRRWVSRSPVEEIRGVGKRKHGKGQLRIDEARRWVGKATELAKRGESGAVAALVALLMGMRASEITTRVVRDLDDGGSLLWIPEAKTEAGKRTLQVPAVLQPYLRALAAGKGPQERLFGHHWRDWVRKWVKRICVMTSVPEVTAHGMRGLHSTLALEHGASAHVVASSLGHESFSTTVESYAKPEALEGARQKRVMTVLDGGRLASSI
jgi:integrase